MKIATARPESKEVVAREGRGRLERHRSRLGELPVLHLAGTYEEMGRQYGALAGRMIRQNLQRTEQVLSLPGMPEGTGVLVLRKAWERLRPHVPQRYLDEMAAISQGACDAGVALSVSDLEFITAATNLDMYKREERLAELLGDEAVEGLDQTGGQPTMSCTMLAVWGSRTVDGKLFSHRNLDWLSQTGMHHERLVTVYRPEGKTAFVTMGYAGVIGALAGMNEKGITLSEVGAFSVSEELDGTPWTLTARRVLEESSELQDAVAIIQDAKHTLGYNYLIADGDPDRFGTDAFTPGAAAFETNHQCCELFTENDAKEVTASWTGPNGETVCYGLPMTEAVLRADTAFGSQARAQQAADNGPGEQANSGDPRVPGSTYVECHQPMHDMLQAYASGDTYVYPLRGTKVIEAGRPRKVGVAEVLTIAATVAHNTEKLDVNDWNVMSVVCAATDVEFWVAYESQDEQGHWRNAPDSGYWHFKLDELR